MSIAFRFCGFGFTLVMYYTTGFARRETKKF